MADTNTTGYVNPVVLSKQERRYVKYIESLKVTIRYNLHGAMTPEFVADVESRIRRFLALESGVESVEFKPIYNYGYKPRLTVSLQSIPERTWSDYTILFMCFCTHVGQRLLDVPYCTLTGVRYLDHTGAKRRKPNVPLNYGIYTYFQNSRFLDVVRRVPPFTEYTINEAGRLMIYNEVVRRMHVSKRWEPGTRIYTMLHLNGVLDDLAKRGIYPRKGHEIESQFTQSGDVPG